MNYNQENKDFTQYAIKTSEILSNIFETLNKFKDCNNEEEKAQIYSELSENITNFELTLDSCSIDVNESITKLIKDRNEKKGNINNTNMDTENNQGAREFTMSNIEQISDTELINHAVKQISNIKLNI